MHQAEQHFDLSYHNPVNSSTKLSKGKFVTRRKKKSRIAKVVGLIISFLVVMGHPGMQQ